VTIDAPVEKVWPWLAQLGQDRAGFYSYEWLENLAGCEMKNADRMRPEWQHRELGETVHLHPAGGLKVTVFEPGRALGLEGWGTFALEPLGSDRTRLIAAAASRAAWVPSHTGCSWRSRTSSWNGGCCSGSRTAPKQAERDDSRWSQRWRSDRSARCLIPSSIFRSMTSEPGSITSIPRRWPAVAPSSRFGCD
jgi:hypothetical protein